MADTPLDPRYKRGFYLDQTGIVGRKRARAANIPDNHVDFLSINERAELIVEGQTHIAHILTDILTELKQMTEALASLR